MTRKVVVVGAGAAGLKATGDLLKAGLQVDLIEARARFGGRAWTDSSLGTPIDLGCQWLHDAPDNPWVVEAQRLKIKTGKQIKEDYYFDPQALSPESSEQIRQHVEDLESKLDADYSDSAASNAAGGAKVDTTDPWYPVAAARLAALEESVELGEFSAVDRHPDKVELPYSFEFPQGNGFNYLPRGGYGALIEAYAQDLVTCHGKGGKGTGRLSVFLSHQATLVHRANTTLTVKTNKLPSGSALSFKPSAVLVAVPTSVIAGKKLKFVPQLPVDTATAFEKLPMGHFKKVALKFKCDIFKLDSYATKLKAAELKELRKTFPKLEAGDEIWPRPARSGHTWKFICNLNEANVVVGFVGGALAQQLEKEQDQAVIRHALDRITAMMGSVLGPHVKGMYANQAVVSHWTTDPWSLGAYSYTKPGGKGARMHLYGQPMSDHRIFFAGEALWQNSYGTAHGAYYTGAAAAAALLKSLG